MTTYSLTYDLFVFYHFIRVIALQISSPQSLGLFVRFRFTKQFKYLASEYTNCTSNEPIINQLPNLSMNNLFMGIREHTQPLEFINVVSALQSTWKYPS